MSRLTEFRKDLNRYEYKQDERGYCWISEGQIVNKLGKLEDLLQSYNVEDLEELDKLLGMATAYEELSKQLGCPLEVVFKALKGFPKSTGKPINLFYDECSKQYLISSGDGEWTPYENFELKNYKEWLKEDRSE